ATELNASTSSVTVTTDTVRSGDAITAVTFTLDVLATRGADTPLDLDTVADDLGITLLSPPTVTVGGGVRYKMTVSLDLATSVVTVSFDETKTGGFGGLSFEELTTDIAIGMIGGQFVDASGSAGVLLPLDFGGNASRTVADWASATVSSFGAATGTADFTLPITAGINGTTVTTANTQVVVADTDIFDDEPPLYTTTDFDTVRWFAGLTTERVIQQLLDVGSIYGSLTSSGSDLLGVTVPFVADTSLGDLFDFKSLFDAEIGSKIDIYQPILNTTGRDELLDWRLPISEDSTPVQSLYSDLRGGFAFGIVVNETWPVHTVSVEARDRNTLADLVSDINAALEALEGGSGIGITAEIVSSKLVFRATEIAVQSFAIVPVAVEAGRLVPADGEGKTVGELEPGWYTVTGSKEGVVSGTNYYSAATPLAAAAVHAGLLADGQTGVVRVHGLTTGIALGSTRHGITSLPLLVPGSTYLVSSGEVELARLGITPLGEPLAVLETADTAGLTATLPLRATTAAASLRIGSGSGVGTVVTVAAQSNAEVVQTLAAVNAALATAGVSANVQARLVTSAGVVISGDPTGTAYLQFFRPTGSTWSTLAIAPVSDGQANETVELGFLVGDIAARPRPAALRTFDDFRSDALFPGITITPVYTPPTDTSPGFVTMQFAASGSGTVNRAADISFKTTPLGAVTFANDSTVSLPTTYGLNFGVRFGIGPSSPAVLVAGSAPVATGRLTADATLSLDLVMQDRYTVSLPSAWTTDNGTPQDLVSDLNRALGQATNSDEESVDLLATDRLVARYGQFSGRIELVTASRANDGAAVVIDPASLTGDLAADLDVSFTYAGRTWTITVPAADTAVADTLQSRIGQLNTALADATPASGAGESLYDRVFFTTRSTSAGGVEVLLASVDPPAESWPATVRLTAARSNAAVTALGFSDGGSAATSEIVARASGVTAAITQHSNGQPFAIGTLDTTLPSLSGSTMLGFNAIAFGGSSGEIDAKIAISVPNPVATAVALTDLAGSFTRTLTKSDGTGTASAGITLESLSASSTIAAGATIAISVPDLADITTIVDQALGIPVPVPFQSVADDGFTLIADATIVFIANSATYTVTVTAAQAAGNGSFADLVADFNASLAGSGGTGGATIRRRGDTAAAAAGDISDEFVIKAVGDRLQVFARVPAANPDYGVTTLLPNIGAFGELGLQGSFGVATVADALAEALGVFDTLRFDVAALAVTELPLLNQPLGELIRLDTGLARRIDALRTANVTGPAGLAPAISRALGLTADRVGVAFDDSRS
ncbi:MAG: LCCL domain-containing protein, partial [Planctomycetaceae bacterium]